MVARTRKITSLTPLQVDARQAFLAFAKQPSREHRNRLNDKCDRLTYAFIEGVEALNLRDEAEGRTATETTQQVDNADTRTAEAQAVAEGETVENNAEAEVRPTGRRRTSNPEAVSAAA